MGLTKQSTVQKRKQEKTYFFFIHHVILFSLQLTESICKCKTQMHGTAFNATMLTIRIHHSDLMILSHHSTSLLLETLSQKTIYVLDILELCSMLHTILQAVSGP